MFHKTVRSNNLRSWSIHEKFSRATGGWDQFGGEQKHLKWNNFQCVCSFFSTLLLLFGLDSIMWSLVGEIESHVRYTLLSCQRAIFNDHGNFRMGFPKFTLKCLRWSTFYFYGFSSNFLIKKNCDPLLEGLIHPFISVVPDAHTLTGREREI